MVVVVVMVVNGLAYGMQTFVAASKQHAGFRTVGSRACPGRQMPFVSRRCQCKGVFRLTTVESSLKKHVRVLGGRDGGGRGNYTIACTL